jgi:hypothetical protein
VAVPLADLDPDFKHPITNEPLETIADRLRPEAELTHREDIEAILKALIENTSVGY